MQQQCGEKEFLVVRNGRIGMVLAEWKERSSAGGMNGEERGRQGVTMRWFPCN